MKKFYNLRARCLFICLSELTKWGKCEWLPKGLASLRISSDTQKTQPLSKLFFKKKKKDSRRVHILDLSITAKEIDLWPWIFMSGFIYLFYLFIQNFKRVTYLARRPVYHMALWTYNWYIKHGNKRTVLWTYIQACMMEDYQEIMYMFLSVRWQSWLQLQLLLWKWIATKILGF